MLRQEEYAGAHLIIRLLQTAILQMEREQEYSQAVLPASFQTHYTMFVHMLTIVSGFHMEMKSLLQHPLPSLVAINYPMRVRLIIQ